MTEGVDDLAVDVLFGGIGAASLGYLTGVAAGFALIGVDRRPLWPPQSLPISPAFVIGIAALVGAIGARVTVGASLVFADVLPLSIFLHAVVLAAIAGRAVGGLAPSPGETAASVALANTALAAASMAVVVLSLDAVVAIREVGLQVAALGDTPSDSDLRRVAMIWHSRSLLLIVDPILASLPFLVPIRVRLPGAGFWQRSSWARLSIILPVALAATLWVVWAATGRDVYRLFGPT